MIRDLINWWRNLIMRRQMDSAFPRFRELRRKKEACRKGHKAGARRAEKEMRQAVHMALAGGKTRLKVESR